MFFVRKVKGRVVKSFGNPIDILFVMAERLKMVTCRQPNF